MKVTDKNETEPIEDKTSIKASERTRSHLISPGNNHRKFDSPEDMVKSAEATFTNSRVEEMEKDKANGFDVNDVNSIINFEINYTPMGRTLLVKFINEEQKIGSILIPARNTDVSFMKGIVVVPGLFTTNLKAGDIITMKGSDRNNPLPPFVDRKFNDVNFKEIPEEAVAGVFIKRDILIGRIAEENKKLSNG